MTKKPGKESPNKLRHDVAETAYRVMMEATGQAPKTLPAGERPKEQRHQRAVKLGKKGGKIGGKARTDRLTPEELAELAKKGAGARWKDHKVAKN